MSDYDLPSIADLESVKEQRASEEARQKDWYIWGEGYRATGEHGTATLMNDREPIRAESFDEAVKKLIRQTDPKERYLFSYNTVGGYWTYWACRLYDNEKDARRSFG